MDLPPYVCRLGSSFLYYVLLVVREVTRNSRSTLSVFSFPRRGPCTADVGPVTGGTPRSKPWKLSTLQVAGLCLALTVVDHPKAASATTLDFEGFPDSTILTNQYPEVTFTNAIILSAGISLNEFEFPPHSGVNVASDNGGPLTIEFATPIVSFSGYFTYTEPLTLQGVDSSSIQVASAASLFSNNEALSGDPGSSPNELIQLMFAGGMSEVTITGDPAGGSFALDDASYADAASAVPEPSTALTSIFAVIATVIGQIRYTKQRQL